IRHAVRPVRRAAPRSVASTRSGDGARPRPPAAVPRWTDPGCSDLVGEEVGAMLADGVAEGASAPVRGEVAKGDDAIPPAGDRLPARLGIERPADARRAEDGGL